MRWTQSLIPTQKQVPADAVIISHQLMLRAGLIRQLTAGAYEFLPLGLRALRKAEAIVRREMDASGAAEVLLPALQPVELWQASGRDELYGQNLMRFKDRHGRENVLGPTHEEVITDLVKSYVGSYKQLPLNLYQIQTKFRDEFRPRFGLLRVREFVMKDAYSFDATEAGLAASYDTMYATYERIFTACGVPYVVVEAESGPIGGSGSHEFMANCSAGEDVLLTSDKHNYAANQEKAQTGPRPHDFAGEPAAPLEKLHTPGLPGIDLVAAHLKVTPADMLKTLLFKVQAAGGGQAAGDLAKVGRVLAVVRGDHDVNEAKLADAAKAAGLIAADATLSLFDIAEATAAGYAIGYVGPHQVMLDPAAGLVVDFDAARGTTPWVTGANEKDQHVRNFNWFRECGDVLADPARCVAADVRNALAGDPSPKNDGGTLQASRGIELGHVFKLGTRYSVALDANVLDEKQQSRPVIMGCYGIGIGRILIAAVENFNDDRGIIWPRAIAPYEICITPIKYDGEMKAAADTLYADLKAAGYDIILDDRDARPGAKFADADLCGFPLRITVGDRGLKEGKLEAKRRTDAEATMIDVADAVQQAGALLADYAPVPVGR
ncbi:MAG: proline--tRNA ligase [Phycisphaerae bacterium]